MISNLQRIINIALLLSSIAVSRDFSYDPFVYDKEQVNIFAIMLDRININGAWYKIGEEFDDQLIVGINGKCVKFQDVDNVIEHCLYANRFLSIN